MLWWVAVPPTRGRAVDVAVRRPRRQVYRAETRYDRTGVYMVRDGGWADIQNLLAAFKQTLTKQDEQRIKKRIRADLVDPLADDIRAAGRRSDGQ